MIQCTFNFKSLRSLINFMEKNDIDIDKLDICKSPLTCSDEIDATVKPVDIHEPIPGRVSVHKCAAIEPKDKPQPKPVVQEPVQIKPPIQEVAEPAPIPVMPEINMELVSVASPLTKQEEVKPPEPAADTPPPLQFNRPPVEDPMNTQMADKLDAVVTPAPKPQPQPRQYKKVCTSCNEEFIAKAPSTHMCDKCKENLAKQKASLPGVKTTIHHRDGTVEPKNAPSSEPKKVKSSGKCIRCGLTLPEGHPTKLCVNCAKTMSVNMARMSEAMQNEIKRTLENPNTKVSRVCARCRTPFFTEEGNPASYCPKCLEKLEAAPSELEARPTGHFVTGS
jgi:hypothetical protein